MKLFHAPDVGMERLESAFFWQCVNSFDTWNGTDCLQCDRRGPIPDRRYNWEWWAEGIPEEHLLADLELARDYIKEWNVYPRKSRVTAARQRKIKRVQAFVADTAGNQT